MAKQKYDGAKLKEAKLALGAILGFYRRIHKFSQQKMGKRAGLTASSIAMFEAGKRLPSLEALKKLSFVLGLGSFQSRQLEILAEYPRRTSAGHEWFLPDDVLTGVPLFLRDLKKETQFQSRADIHEMWVVTGKPLALDGEMYSMLSNRLSERKTTFVYFMDSTAGAEPFQALWEKMLSERRHRRKELSSRLKCVLTPATFCLYHFAICNPSDDFDSMFGRSISYGGGAPIGFAGMDAQQVRKAYQLLGPIYQRCSLNPGTEIDTLYGRFRLLQLPLKR